METTLYDDGNRTSVKKMKLEMSLDLAPGEKTNKTPMKLHEHLSDVIGLSTPDLGLFMLTSPDLERFIIQQNGLVLTTPTPTAQILFPKSVTEEQEAYARGFIDALGELHKNYGQPLVAGGETAVNSSNIPSAVAVTGTNTASTNAVNHINKAANDKISATFVAQPVASEFVVVEVPPAAVYTTLRTSKPTATKPTTRSFTIQRGVVHPSLQSKVMQPSFPSKVELVTPKIEPLKVNLADDCGSDKLERRRARNRLAATRCRNRKLEKISRLETRVAELKDENEELTSTAIVLRDEVFRLKQTIIEHSQQGCTVVIDHNLFVID